jgi:multiple sugar transport system substrate-binding protein
VEKVIADYAAETGVPAVAEHIPGNYATKLNALVAGNIEPDAGYLDEGMAMQLGDAGRLANIADYFDVYPEFETLMPQVLHEFRPGEFLVQSAIEMFMLFYDTEVVKEAGVTVPSNAEDAWTWDEFVEAADTLTVDSEGRHPSEDGYDPQDVVRYGVSGLSAQNVVLNLLMSAHFDTEEARDVIQKIQDLVLVHRVSPSPAQMQSIGGDASSQLTGGRVAMVAEGQWGLLAMAATEVDFDLGVLPVFQEPVTMTFSGANAAFASTERPDDTFGLLAALANPDKNPLFSNGLWMPLQETCYTDEAFIEKWMSNDAYPPGYRGACIDATYKYGKPGPNYQLRNWSFVSRQFGNVIGSVWTGQTDVQAVCASLDEQLTPLMRGRFEESE